MTKNQIIEFSKQQGYAGCSFLKKWKGYDIYEPFLRDNETVSYIGLPYVILVKDNSIRMSTADEALSI